MKAVSLPMMPQMQQLVAINQAPHMMPQPNQLTSLAAQIQHPSLGLNQLLLDTKNNMALIPMQLSNGHVETIMAYYNPQDFVGLPEQQALYKWNDLATKARNAYAKGQQAKNKAKALFNQAKGPVKNGLHVANGISQKYGGVAQTAAGAMLGPKGKKAVVMAQQGIKGADAAAQKLLKMQ